MPSRRATSPSAALQRLYRVSDASWTPAGIRKAAVANLMRPAQFGHHQPRGKKVRLMDKVAVAASKTGATAVLFDIGVTAEAKI
jgi:hypothetical protein